jgi:hypothetical protein
MDEEIKNITEETNEESLSVPYDCNSVCPVCSLVHNDCVLGDNHEEKHMCANGHFWL